MTILDTWEKMTDEEKRAALIECMGQVDNVTLFGMACCVDVYQRKQAGTLAAKVSYKY